MSWHTTTNKRGTDFHRFLSAFIRVHPRPIFKGEPMLEALIVICLLLILGILFWPRRTRPARQVTRSRNGQPYWKDQELY